MSCVYCGAEVMLRELKLSCSRIMKLSFETQRELRPWQQSWVEESGILSQTRAFL